MKLEDRLAKIEKILKPKIKIESFLDLWAASEGKVGDKFECCKKIEELFEKIKEESIKINGSNNEVLN
jgi:hypothetical protein